MPLSQNFPQRLSRNIKNFLKIGSFKPDVSYSQSFAELQCLMRNVFQINECFDVPTSDFSFDNLCITIETAH